jgi:hypothetical protein
MKKLKNYAINAAYISMFWGIVGILAKHSAVIAAFNDAPIYAQTFVFTWFTLAFFIAIVHLYNKIMEDGIVTDKERKVWFSFAYPFGFVDGTLNIVFISPFLLQAANSMDEGWMLTQHARAIRRYSLHKTTDLTILEAWRFWHCENWIGPLMNLAQKGHYSS